MSDTNVSAERTGQVTFQGNPMTLVGSEIHVGDTAPSAGGVGVAMNPVAPLTDGAGKAKLFITVPSVDTPVCSMESKKFSEKLKALDASDVAVYVASADLPFAQNRWCGAEGVDNLTMVSDYKDGDLGRAWGLRVKEMGLLARAVYVVDKSDKVTYREIVSDIAGEPDYDAALDALKAAA